MARIELDARGLKCPLPVLRAAKLLKTMNPGDVLVVLATDAAAPGDFAAFCDTTGNSRMSSATTDGVHVIEIGKV